MRYGKTRLAYIHRELTKRRLEDFKTTVLGKRDYEKDARISLQKYIKEGREEIVYDRVPLALTDEGRWTWEDLNDDRLYEEWPTMENIIKHIKNELD